MGRVSIGLPVDFFKNARNLLVGMVCLTSQVSVQMFELPRMSRRSSGLRLLRSTTLDNYANK
jgi:hypothetical protein